MTPPNSTSLTVAPSWRTPALQIITLTLAVICLFTIINRHRALYSGESIDPYRASELVARYAALRPTLQGLNMTGWMASRPVGASEADEVAYSIARYTLAPVLLCNHSKHQFVVADFDSESELETLLKGDEYQLVYQAPTGPVVLERVSP